MKKTSAYRLSLIIMTVLLIMWGTIMTIVLIITRNSSAQEVESRYEGIILHANEKIRGVLSDVYVAAINNVSLIENDLDSPDKLQKHLEKMVRLNNYMSSCRLIFEPDFYPERGHYFEIYAWRDSTGTIRSKQMNEQHPDYLTHSWLQASLDNQKGDWTPPYIDRAASQQLTTTYLTPIHNQLGRQAGLLGADVSLEWLRQRHKRIDQQNHERFEKGFKEQSYSFIIDNDGTYLIHPDESRVLKKTFQEVAASTPDPADDNLAHLMMDRQSGSGLTNNNGVSSVLFYSYVKYADWTVVIAVPEAIINHQGNMLGTIIMAVMLFGLVIIFLLSRTLIKNIDKLRNTSAQKAAIEQELKIASHIQQQMLPKKYPPYPDRSDIDIFGEIVTAKEVGGDLYDFLLNDEKLFFCIGDVSGKGVPASLMMAETISLFRCEAMLHSSPQTIVKRMNKTLCESNDSFMFVTLFLGVLDLQTGQLTYTNAGHEPPLLVRSLARFIYVDNNVPLGLRPDWEYTEQQVLMDNNEILLLYTDGYTEAETANHEHFGRERIRNRSNRLADLHLDARQFAHQHYETAQSFVGDTPQSDDISLLAIRFMGQSAANTYRRSLTLSNDFEEVMELTDFVKTICQDHHLDDTTTSFTTLAVEEAVVNVMKYAYPDRQPSHILLQVEADEHTLTFTLRDKGMPFDATLVEEVDVEQQAEQRIEGGLGIHLMRHYMDHISYERKGDENVLVMQKQL